MLTHHIYRCSHNLNRTSKPGWLKFGFPLMYQTDVLEIVDILSALGVRDSRMDGALKLVLSKQDDMGKMEDREYLQQRSTSDPNRSKRRTEQMAYTQGYACLKISIR